MSAQANAGREVVVDAEHHSRLRELKKQLKRFERKFFGLYERKPMLEDVKAHEKTYEAYLEYNLLKNAAPAAQHSSISATASSSSTTISSSSTSSSSSSSSTSSSTSPSSSSSTCSSSSSTLSSTEGSADHGATSAVGPLRYNFLLQCLVDLDTQLRDKGSRLIVLRGTPLAELRRVCLEWEVSLLTFEADSEPYAESRDREVRSMAEDLGVHVHTEHSHTLHSLGAYGDCVSASYSAFIKGFDKRGAVRQALEVPDIPGLGGVELPAGDGAVPSLEEMGFALEECHKVLYPGGEREALRRMEESLRDKKWVQTFEKPNTSPNALEPSTTVLSPYLKFGALSPVLFYHKLQEIARESKHSTQPPVSLTGQLLWREFFYAHSAHTPNFGRMDGNPLCRRIPWSRNQERLRAWREARTGFPFIDAIMTQLRTEGWIHHLARHAVACFLTRGDLWVHWECGVAVFEELLLDADWALNSGNWMWLSASAFFHQYFRVYSPVAFGKKTDKSGAYIRKYLPQLKHMPDKYIYEPWQAPLDVQKKAKCVIGKDYPAPIVDHAEASSENKQRMKEAYEKHREQKDSGGGSGASSNAGSKRRAKGSGEGATSKRQKRS
eukprot:TRINITY_DN2928_c0_g1_i2.p1 TRINITY_DN2928_c0_g1~~TRINITY_DN2928_c0_g1_i2.p1  ORF type:complete len:609 (+),score=215.41 TRINITY_DN2928_c0_g1_i2:210-2036(+)